MGRREQVRGLLSRVGRNLSTSEIERIKRRTGVGGGISALARREGINVRDANAPAPSSEGSEEGMYPNVFDYTKTLNLINAQGNIDTEIANLNADAAKEVERIRGRSAVDVAGIEAGASRYQADRALESALGVENIRARGAIDLQGVVNAGLERVEGIRGEYGLRGKMLDRGTSIYAGLVNAFNFS